MCFFSSGANALGSPFTQPGPSVDAWRLSSLGWGVVTSLGSLTPADLVIVFVFQFGKQLGHMDRYRSSTLPVTEEWKDTLMQKECYPTRNWFPVTIKNKSVGSQAGFSTWQTHFLFVQNWHFQRFLIRHEEIHMMSMMPYNTLSSVSWLGLLFFFFFFCIYAPLLPPRRDK